MARLLHNELRPYQRRASSFAVEKRTVALFMEQRTGKTITCLHAVARLWRSRSVRRVLVVAPKTNAWHREARKHLAIPYQFGGNPDGESLHFLLINFEQTWRREQELIAYRPDVVIVDESQRIKNDRSRQSKATYRIGRNAAYRLILTGTPTDGDDLHLWAQFRFLKPELLGDDWMRFVWRWCRRSGFAGKKWKLKKHLVKRFYALLAPYTFRIRKEEAYQVPNIVDAILPFQLTGQARRSYVELERDLMTQVGDEVVMTPMTVTQLIRLQQLTGGFLNSDEATIRLEQDKLAALIDWLQDSPINRKIVVFARFREEIEALRVVLSRTRTVATLHGGTKDRTIWEKFQEEKDPSVLIVQQKSGGTSIELSAADVAVFYSIGHSWLDYDQARARLLGSNQGKNVLFLHMVAEQTVDEDMIALVNKKGFNAEDILRQLQQRRREMATAKKKVAPKKGAVKKTAVKKTAPPPAEKPEFGLDYLVVATGLTAATLRQKLRAAGIKKSGRVYDFRNKTEAEKIVKQMAPKKAA